MHATFCRLIVATGLIAPILAWGDTPPVDENRDYDPLVVIRTVPMLYPPELASQNIYEGEVRVVVWVDDTDHLMDWLLVGHTNPLFAREVLNVLPKWKFRAARVQGQPVNTRTEVRIIFKDTDVIRLIAGGYGLAERMKEDAIRKKKAQRIYSSDELDQPLDPVVEISPQPPDRLGAVAKEGIVVVEYLVDEDGKVRMPMIISSDDQAFTNSVLLAITECRFAVPKHSGKPVITRVRQKFTFSPTS